MEMNGVCNKHGEFVPHISLRRLHMLIYLLFISDFTALDNNSDISVDNVQEQRAYDKHKL